MIMILQVEGLQAHIQVQAKLGERKGNELTYSPGKKSTTYSSFLGGP